MVLVLLIFLVPVLRRRKKKIVGGRLVLKTLIRTTVVTFQLVALVMNYNVDYR